MSKNGEKLVKINYFENIRSHHPKSIIYWVTEGIIIDDKRYPIEEFRLKDDGLYAVVSQNDKEYFEVFLNTYDDTEILSQLKELDIRLTAEEQKEDKDTTYTAGNGLILSGTEFSIDDSKVTTQQELEEIERRLTAEEQKEDKDTTYTAGNGLTLTGTEFSIDDTQLATQAELEEIDIRLTAEEQKEDKDTTYKAGEGLLLDGTTFSVNPTKIPKLSQLNDLGDRVTTLEGKSDADTKYTAGTNVQISPTNVISATDTKYSAGNGINLSNYNVFSLKANAYPMGSGFTYTNPFITIGFIDQGHEDVNTGTVTYTVNFNAINGIQVKNILLINPTNLEYTRYSNKIIVSSGKGTFSFSGLSNEIYNSPSTGGKVLIIAEIIS